MVRLIGRVCKETYAKGSKSEHEAVMFCVEDRFGNVTKYKLRRPGGNPFQDEELEKLVGQHLEITGSVAENIFIMKRYYGLIPFNIWDDFWDDFCTPVGQIQRTHGYIDEFDVITDEEKGLMVKFLFEKMKNIDLMGATMECGEIDIDFINLTHARLDMLIPELESMDIRYNGRPFIFYSES